MSEEDIEAVGDLKKRRKRKTETDDYTNIVYKMLNDGIAPEVIFSYCLLKGYKGKYENLSNRIKTLAINNFDRKIHMNFYCDRDYPKDVIVIKRSEILKYITTKDEKKGKNEDVEKYIELIEAKYPLIREMEEMFDLFHTLLMGDDVSKLHEFIERYKGSKIDSFVIGLKKDITAVENAISFEISSGFVEGNNNKFKLIKRILYGRSGIVNLFKKCYIPFLMNNVDFKLRDLI